MKKYKLIGALIGFVLCIISSAVVFAEQMNSSIVVKCFDCPSLYTGFKFPIVAKVQNSGANTETVTVSFTLPLSWVYTSNDLVRVVDVGPGQTVQVELDAQVPDDAPSGNYTLGAQLDSSQLVTVTAFVKYLPPPVVCSAGKNEGCEPPQMLPPLVTTEKQYLPLIADQ